MKKYFSFLLVVALFGLIFIPGAFAENKVGIKSIDLVEKSENTSINSEPKFNNLEMNFDVAFKAKDDYVKYKVVVSNNTDIDYKISEDTSFNDSQYMTYKYDVENELKANDETVVYVTITYSKEIDSSKLTNGKYSESNQAIVQLLDRNGNIINPNTSSSIMMILINLFIVSFVSILLFIKFRNKKTLPLVLILGLSLIPISTYAVETLKLTINITVEIEKGYRVDILYNDDDEGLMLTEDELKEMDVSGLKCDKEIYNITDIVYDDTKKYTYCKGDFIYKDNKLYSAGEKVDLKTIYIKYFDLGEYDSSTKMFEYCTMDSNNNLVFNCNAKGGGILNPESYRWLYKKSVSNDYNYPFFDTDTDIMNFSHYSGAYDSYAFGFYPVTFTMPDHDVLFTLYY